MKKRLIGISFAAIIVAVLIVRISIVSNRYTLPEIKEIKIGDSFTAQGITYTFESMDMYDYEGILEKYELNPEELIFNNLDMYEKKHYVMKYSITIEDENYKYNETNFGYINKYSAGYSHHELPFIYGLNDSFEIDMEKGESGTYYMVISLIDYEYTEETFDSLSLDDMVILFYDKEKAIEYRMKAK